VAHALQRIDPAECDAHHSCGRAGAGDAGAARDSRCAHRGDPIHRHIPC
jgi:hypothetical protein